MKTKTLIALGLVFGLLSTLSANATPIHRKSCEFPLDGVEVCWEATADLASDHAPFDELHMLPIAREIDGSEEVLVDYTKDVFRQLLPGDLAERLIPEWTPVFSLEDALTNRRGSDWPALLWIAPRVMRNSSASGPGVVDWDVYIIQKNRLVRTMRIRVASKPKIGSDAFEKTVLWGSTVAATGALKTSPWGSIASVVSTATTGIPTPPEAGHSLELMTELATRQLLFLAQYPIEALNPPQSPNPSIPGLQRLFGPK